MLILGLCTVVLTFGLCMHKISTASMAGTIVFCVISIDFLASAISLLVACGQVSISAWFVKSQNARLVITLFCCKFEYCRVYTLFVPIFYPKSVLVLIFTLFLHVCKKQDFSFKDVNLENGIAAAFRGWQLQ